MKIQYVAVILTGPKENNKKQTNGHYLNQNWAKLLTFGVCHATLIFINTPPERMKLYRLSHLLYEFL